MSENADIYRIDTPDGREIILIGTAHISKASKELVRETIEAESPDTVCVELDEGRAKSIQDPDRWKKTDLKEVIKKKQLATLIANLVLGSYQKRMGEQTGVKPGSELKEAVDVSGEKNIPVVLADRDIKITLKRTWACTPWYRKFSLLGGLFGSIFDKTEISEEELAKIKEQDALNSMMQEFGKSFPEVKQVLIDERDQFLASKIKNAPGKKVVAVVGAGHVKGIAGIISENKELPSEESISVIPKGAPHLENYRVGYPACDYCKHYLRGLPGRRREGRAAQPAVGDAHGRRRHARDHCCRRASGYHTGGASCRPVYRAYTAYRGRVLYRAHSGVYETAARFRDGNAIRRYLAGKALVEKPRDPRDSLLPVSGHPGDYREGPGDLPDIPGVLEH